MVEHLEPRQLLSVPYVYLNSQLLIGEGSTLMVGVGAFCANTNEAITVRYTVTPSASQDFEPLSGEVTVGPWNWPGSSGANIELKTNADNLVEGDEWVTITLLPDPEGSYVIGIYGVPPEYVPPGVGTATVQIVDSPPLATIERVSDGSEDGAPMVFRVARSGGKSSEPITLSYSISGTGANPASGGDYTAPSGQITIPADASSAVLEVQVSDDSEIEAAYEQAMVTLTGGGMGQSYLVNAQASTATATIQDNDFEITAAYITFNSQGLRKDDGTGYAGSHWEDLDGTPGANDTSNPLSFERSDSQQQRFIAADVVFHISGNPTAASYKLTGNGSGLGGGLFESGWVAMQSHSWVGRYLSWSVQSAEALPTTIDHGELSVSWEVTPINRPNTDVSYGSTTNTAYVTGAAAPDQFETVAKLGCEGAKGKTPGVDDAAIISGIWGRFSGNSTERIDGTVMKYWGPIASQNYADPARQAENFSFAGLLKHGDGRCAAWARLLVQVMAAQGLTSSVTTISPDVTVTGAPAGWEAAWTQFEVSKTAGQGGTPSSVRFANHAVVEYLGQIYDPSYGGNPFPSRQAWEDDSLLRFVTLWEDPLDRDNNWTLIPALDPKGTLQTDWN